MGTFLSHRPAWGCRQIKPLRLAQSSSGPLEAPAALAHQSAGVKDLVSQGLSQEAGHRRSGQAAGPLTAVATCVGTIFGWDSHSGEPVGDGPGQAAGAKFSYAGQAGLLGPRGPG